MDPRALRLLEFDRVASWVAEHAASDDARAALASATPIADRVARADEVECLDQAIRRNGEPGEWCATAPGSVRALLEDDDAVLDGPALVQIGSWLAAADATRDAWTDETRARHPGLASRVDAIDPPPGLRTRLERSLDPDGTVRDSASPALARARAELRDATRRLEQKLEHWARGFGSDAYVTRHGDRFVALVPAAGFPRRRALVHDVSNSGQSLFVEPLEMHEDNNRLLELRAAAFEEERRVLRELAGAVLDERERVLATASALVRLDGLRARARWARAISGRAVLPDGERLTLRSARHPLLMAGERAADVVPLDLELGTSETAEGRLLLVSGPNMGGKTVLLKTVGLCVLLAHAAFPVPADEGSRIPEIDAVGIDLGDEQSLDKGLSTFAAHLEALADMARRAGPRTLVLCDELGAGTDPDEGGALARALLEHFARQRTWGVVTTHLGSLKRVAGETPGVRNGSLEFDLATLQPRYRFIPDVPGASHALAVAERLGFPSDLLARARHLTPESARALERLTGELAAALADARERAVEHERARLAAEQEAQHLHETAEALKKEGSERRRALTRESEVLLARVRELWQTIQREARREHKARGDVTVLKSEIDRSEAGLAELVEKTGGDELPVHALPVEALTPGRQVRVSDLGVDAEVVAGPDAEGRVTLRRGNWTIHSRADRLVAAEAAPRAATQPVTGQWSTGDEAPSLDVDVRGLDVDDALRALDAGLDRAVVAGFQELRVIHGIGRGVLRQAVEKHLRSHAQVSGQRMAQQNEGGRGVTVATLR